MKKSLWILWLPIKLDPTPCPLVPPVADVHQRGSWWSGQAAPETHCCWRPIQASSGARFPRPPLGGAAGPLIPPTTPTAATPTAALPPPRSVPLRTVLCGPWGCSWSTGAPSCGLQRWCCHRESARKEQACSGHCKRGWLQLLVWKESTTSFHSFSHFRVAVGLFHAPVL